jgi:hypothetical protein
VTTHTVAIWNAKVGRGRGPRVARHIARYSAKHGIDVWLLQEVDGFRRNLARIPGFTAYQPKGWPLAGNCAILVRDTLPSGNMRVIRYSKRWPRPKLPGLHPARTDVMVWVDGIDYMSNHQVSWKGRPRGRAQRHAAARDYAIRLAALALAHPGPLVIGGDQNSGPTEAGLHQSPWIAANGGLRIIRNGRIEHFLVKGATVADAATDFDRAGSDHPIIRGKVTPTTTPLPPPDDDDDDEEPEDVLSPADRDFIVSTVATTVQAALAAQTLDVGKPNPWTDDQVAKVQLSAIGRLEAAAGRIETAVADLRAVHEGPPA